MDDIFFNALITTFGISIGTGVIGSFVLWKRLSYFGDTVAHSALLGLTFSMIMRTNQIVGILMVALFPALILLKLRDCYGKDTLLNIISNSTMALSVIVLSLFPSFDTNLMAVLFGDILAINWQDILLIYCVMIFSVLVIVIRWKKWLLVAVSKELARVKGFNTKILELEFVTLLSILIAISINVVGVLLITSLLIIPPAGARILIKTPVQMVILSSIISFLSSVLGLIMSFQFNTPTGPSIIIMSTLILVSANIYSYFFEKITRK
ncbi:MAG: metal ABC transporter permease [Rickettsiaceae bacterium H1]|nr:metal ABC transporter permease [Rickettsiaceae bacterium H1]